MYQNDGRTFVRFTQVKNFLNTVRYVPRVKSGGGETVWGAMSFRGTGNLRNQQKLKPVELY